MCTTCGDLSHRSLPYSRRSFLNLIGGTGLALTLPGQALFAAGEAPKPQNVIGPDQALARLKKGNARYVSGAMQSHDFAMDRAVLASGQNPFAAILSCSDSRVSPEYTFDVGRGDVFVVRIAGNFAHLDALASLEYAVKFLGSTLIVVLGHDECGAVSAAIKVQKDGAELPGHLPELVDSILPAVKTAMREKGDLLANSIRENVARNVRDLRNASPILKRAVEEGKLKVIGGIYKLKNGEVEWLD